MAIRRNLYRKAGPVLLALAAFIKGVILAGLVPLWQGPDEAVHFSYIQYIVEEKSIPVYRLPFQPYATDISPELRQSIADMDREHVAFHPDNIQRFLYAEKPQAATANPERHTSTSAYRNAALGYSPLYYAYGAVAYALSYGLPVEQRALAVRIATALLMVPLVFFSFGLGRILLGQAGGLAFAAFVSFHPMVSFVFSIINNDAMLIASSAGAAYFMARYLIAGGAGQATRAGLMAGLAILAKPHGFFLVAALVAFIVALAVRQKRMEWTPAAAGFGAMAAVALPWLLFGIAHYGHALGPAYIPLQEITLRHPPVTASDILTPMFFRWPYTMFVSFWGNFGHLDTPLPPWLATGLWWTFIAAFASVVAATAKAAFGRAHRRNTLFFACISSVLALDILFALFFFYSIKYEGGQGRYYFAAWPFMSATFFYAYRIFAPARLHWGGYLVFALGMMALFFYSAYSVLLPRYYL